MDANRKIGRTDAGTHCVGRTWPSGLVGLLGVSESRSKVKRLLALVVMALLITACPPPPPPPTTAFVPNPVPEECVIDPTLSREGCFSKNTIHQFSQAITADVYLFYDTLFPSENVAGQRVDGVQTVIVSPGEQVQMSCVNLDGTDMANSTTQVHCSTDNTIYLGIDQTWQNYVDFGDFGASFVIAHEWGHAIQYAVGLNEAVRAYVLANPSEQQAIGILQENQADCMGGAWARHVESGGRLEVDDIDEATSWAEVWGDWEETMFGEARGHGTGEERQAAFHEGNELGLAGCKKFFPEFELPSSICLAGLPCMFDYPGY